MPALPTSADIVIIGGGVMGASTLYHLAKHGLTNVVLLEKEDFFGQGSTGRCAGGVRHQFSTAVNIELSRHSLQMLADFEAETGQPSLFRPVGYLFVLTDEQHVNAFRLNVELQHKHGVDTEWLTPDEIRARIPMFSFPDALGGTCYMGDGLADPNSVVMGYITAARRLGAGAIEGVTVTGLTTDAQGVSAVDTSAGRITTRTVVNCAGAWAAEIGKMIGLDIPVTPVRRQWFTTAPIAEIPEDLPFVIDFKQSLYFHRESGGLLTGMSNPDEPASFSHTVDEDWEYRHMDAAIERLPLLETAGFASHVAGLYEMTPDHHPIFGTTPIGGFHLLTGFSGHGFMHGPVAGLLAAEIIEHGRATTVDVSALDFDRFAEDRLIRELNVI